MKINKVTLYTHDLEGMENFYCTILGFKRLKKSSTVLEIKIGESILAFELSLPDEKTQYHFAFNIPSNLFKEAKEWIQLYTPLLKHNGQDEVYFERINAQSLYFYDPDENVVELIARHSLNPKIHVNQFNADEILNIGEMNLTTEYLIHVGEMLITLGIPVRNNEKLNETSLNFMGESKDDAYILLGPARRNWYFSTKVAVVSRIRLVVNNQLQLEIDKNGLFHYKTI
ncbi:VOC family protein [Lysinibacillus sp. SGAir0095]|uniref:VOC family protein n=1 Tax=Lysinibacillus sp. SGAir0095 TaxID=2070463 RepID=UPI0010CD47CC|nr:VOC family protein [Lysinibacillus sp. SGAir0095]QCR31265.1 glyoxalase [Lysinibacillus sp. SGAir0095]